MRALLLSQGQVGGGHCSYPRGRWDEGDIALGPRVGGMMGTLLLSQGQVGGGGHCSCPRGRCVRGVLVLFHGKVGGW